MTQLPTHVSHYEIVRVLGQGGMGTVYLALDPGLRRQVALKVLRADSDDQRERFRREARIVARLQHPNIVAIYAVGEHNRQLYIAMEYIDGEPLPTPSAAGSRGVCTRSCRWRQTSAAVWRSPIVPGSSTATSNPRT